MGSTWVFQALFCLLVEVLSSKSSGLLHIFPTASVIVYTCRVVCWSELEPCAGRAAADNLWAPPTFVDRRAAAANNLSVRRRCHCCCVIILFQFSMTKWLDSINASNKRDTVHAELLNIDAWATRNNLRLNKSKSREMVILRTVRGIPPDPLPDINRVYSPRIYRASSLETILKLRTI